MRSSFTLSALCAFALASAFEITQPRAGATVDATSNITIAWTTASGDPALVNFYLDGAAASGESPLVAANVSTASGHYVIPANTLNVVDGNYTVVADSTGAEGNALEGQSGVFEVQGKKGTATTSATASGSAASASATSNSAASLDAGVQWSRWTLPGSLLVVALAAH